MLEGILALTKCLFKRLVLPITTIQVSKMFERVSCSSDGGATGLPESFKIRSNRFETSDKWENIAGCCSFI